MVLPEHKSAAKPPGLDLGRGEAIRILLLCGLLAALLFMFFFQGSGADTEADQHVPILKIDVEVPELDAAILAKAKDGSRRERIEQEEEVLRHLLVKSLDVVPSVARALGMPDHQMDLQTLRAHPDSSRGRYLWYEGTLEQLVAGRPSHPVRGFSIHEAQIRTATDDRILFVFSVDPDRALVPGSYVRAEGFFMKLRDRHFPDEINEAPLLVGPELFPAYKAWEPVKELDPEILAQIRDGTLGPDRLLDDPQDIEAGLKDYQNIPLWHMASHARERERTATTQELKAVKAFADLDQWPGFQYGTTPKGSPHRLLGTFIHATTFPARLNPIGVTHWTEVWIQCRDLGGRVIPIWVPKEISSTWRRGNSVEAHGLLLRRLKYQAEQQDRVVPVFVAADIHPFKLAPNPANQLAGYVVFGVIVFGIFLIAFLGWWDRRSQLANELVLIERRRKRRQQPGEDVPATQ